jgi:hypothetical protein
VYNRGNKNGGQSNPVSFWAMVGIFSVIWNNLFYTPARKRENDVVKIN